MRGRTLLLAYAGWLLAAAAISIVAALFVMELVGLLGAPAEGTARHVIFLIASLGGFVVLAALPWLLRNRTIEEE